MNNKENMPELRFCDVCNKSLQCFCLRCHDDLKEEPIPDSHIFNPTDYPDYSYGQYPICIVDKDKSFKQFTHIGLPDVLGWVEYKTICSQKCYENQYDNINMR